MQKTDYYRTNKFPRPDKKDYTGYVVKNVTDMEIYRKGASAQDVEAMGLKLPTQLSAGKVQTVGGVDYLVESLMDEPGYQQALKRHQDESNRLWAEFQHDLAISNGLDPKGKLAAKIFDKAYQDGHSAGHYEIESCYIDLADFAEDVLKAKAEDEAA